MVRSLETNRRTLLVSAAGLLMPGGFQAKGQTLDLRPRRCADFLAAIGVNTHLGFVDSQYRDPSAVIAALNYVGVKFVRDLALNTNQPKSAHYGALAAAGISFCLCLGVKRPIGEILDQIGAFEAAHPGTVHALEGPNEINPNFSYGGAMGNVAGKQFMADLRAAAASNAHLRRTPIVSLTSYAGVAVDCDFANGHPYPKAGMQPGLVVRTAHDRAVGPDGVMPGKPMMFTEFGYHTLVGKPLIPGRWQGVDPELQAVLTINGLLDNALLPITRTYIYQLLDAYPETGGPADQERHFGLFRVDGSPKPAATALRNLSAYLADHGPSAFEFQPSPLAANLVLPAPVTCLPLQDSAGRHFLALWNESPVWNKDAAAPRDVEPIEITVTLPSPRAVRAFDIIDPDKFADFGMVTKVTTRIGAHPLLLRIG